MSKEKPSTFTPYFREVDADQVRAAFAAAGHLEKYTSVAELIEAATLKEIRRMQRKYNNGRPWGPVPSGAVRTGRRSKEELREQAERQAGIIGAKE